MQVREIHLRNFRALTDVKLDLRGLNVLLGANGSGKSTVLEVFDLLRMAMARELGRAISQRGGILDMLPPKGLACEPADSMEIALNLSAAPAPGAAEYRVALEGKPIGFDVVLEELRTTDKPDGSELSGVFERDRAGFHSRGGPAQARALPGPSGELLLASMSDAAASPLRETLSGALHLSPISTGPNSPVRLPQTLDPAPLLPGDQGQELIATLYNLSVSRDHASVFERIADTLKAAVPGFHSIDFPPVAAGKVGLRWNEQYGDAGMLRSFYPHQLSDGTLRFLWLATTLLSPRLPSLVLIDEPEVSLHPEMLKILVGLLRDASQRSQLLVATQSDRLVRWLEPAEIVLLDKENGVTRARRGDDPGLDVQHWLAEFSLDELWLMGQLGGRP